jgi:hypothetical protein
MPAGGRCQVLTCFGQSQRHAGMGVRSSCARVRSWEASAGGSISLLLRRSGDRKCVQPCTCRSDLGGELSVVHMKSTGGLELPICHGDHRGKGLIDGGATECRSGIRRILLMLEWPQERCLTPYSRSCQGNSQVDYAVASTLWYIGVRHSACLSVVPRTTRR